MNVKFSIGVIVECLVFEDDSIKYFVRQPNGQPLSSLFSDEDLGSYLYGLCDNVIAKSTSEPPSANVG